MPHTLLLADDSVTIQRVIELTFADEDVRVVAVSDGEQAIAALDTNPPDIVLADVGMPGRNGYEVARHIKQTPRLAHIPIVLLTGAFEPIDQAKATEVGCDGVLAKPFEPQLVIARVKELLARAKGPVLDGPLSAPPAPWTAQPAEVPAAALPRTAPAKVDDYFDRLDQAFANLAGGDAPAAAAQTAPPAMTGSIDWFSAPPADAAAPQVSDQWDITAPAAFPAADLPLSYGSPQAEFERVGGRDAPATPAPVAPSPAPPLPALADAFAALLAAERTAPASATAPAWPTPPPAAPALTEDVIEQVARRVLERLSDRVVRQTVSEVVASVAERLVREEIERIKASIK